jgi:hypothetical protein
MKRHLSIGLVIFTLLLLSGQALAANTATKTGDTVSVVLDGSTSFELYSVTSVPPKVYLQAIVFKPSAANDYIQVRSGSASGAIIWPANVDVTGGGQAVYYDKLLVDPYIVAGECHFGTAANAVVTFVYSDTKN